jgi:hypothetical protein
VGALRASFMNRNKLNDRDDEQMKEIKKKIIALKNKYGENYAEVIKCVIFYEQIVR